MTIASACQAVRRLPVLAAIGLFCAVLAVFAAEPGLNLVAVPAERSGLKHVLSIAIPSSVR